MPVNDEPISQGDSAPASRERLQKVMAACGVGSRRKCEDLIEQGRVEVDRRVVTELGSTVDPDTQEIRVDGQRLQASRKVYYLVNKPIGYLSTNYDPAGRPRVIDLLPATKERLFTVGRLDMQSEGLMLVTNDGALAQQLTHPRYGVEKTYLVQVAGQPPEEVLHKLVRGVRLAEGSARCVSVTVRSEIKHSTILEIILAEGKNREIRRILAQVGHKVMKLKRVAIGGLKMKDMQPGEVQRLALHEMKQLTERAPPPKQFKPKRRTPAGEETNAGESKRTEKSGGEQRPGGERKRFAKPAARRDRSPPRDRSGRSEPTQNEGPTGRRSRNRRAGKPKSFRTGGQGRSAQERPALQRPASSGKGTRPPYGSKPPFTPKPGKPARPVKREFDETQAEEQSARRHPKPGRGS